MLPPPPFLVFTTGLPGRVADAFQMDAVDYLLKPLDPEQVTTAVNCLLVNIRSKRADLRPQLGTRMNGTKIRLV
jgi:DNA-binding LytR/AlgR family response regulator